jgi:hypothetical protein
MQIIDVPGVRRGVDEERSGGTNTGVILPGPYRIYESR